MLDACKDIVLNQRQQQYGTPENNFERIASYWSVYLKDRIAGGIDSSDVAVMMILLKVARGQHKLDNVDTWLDIAGYAACGCELSTVTVVEGTDV